jgi:hypothetical protein
MSTPTPTQVIPAMLSELRGLLCAGDMAGADARARFYAYWPRSLHVPDRLREVLEASKLHGQLQGQRLFLRHGQGSGGGIALADRFLQCKEGYFLRDDGMRALQA